MLYERLKEIRERAGLSQIEIAKTLGISTTTYNAYENGRQLPRTDTIISICEEFNVSADWLLGTGRRWRIDTTADAVEALEGLREAGAFVGCTTLKFHDEMPFLTPAPTAAVLIDATHFYDTIENHERMLKIIREGMAKEAVDAWYDRELERLRTGEASRLQRFNSDLGSQAVKRLAEKEYDLSPLDLDDI